MTDKLLIFNSSDTFASSDDGYKGTVGVAAFRLSSLSHIVGFENTAGSSIVRLFFRCSSHVDAPQPTPHSSKDHIWYKTYVDIQVEEDGQNEFIYQFSKRVMGDGSPIVRFDQVNDIYGASGYFRTTPNIAIEIPTNPEEIEILATP